MTQGILLASNLFYFIILNKIGKKGFAGKLEWEET
jgi:hypothetical protein